MIWKWLPSLFVNCKSGKDTALVMLNFAPLLVFSPILSFWPAEWQNGNNIRKERKVKWTSGASGQWLYPLLFSLRVFLIKRLVLNDKQATLYLHQRLQAVCNLAKILQSCPPLNSTHSTRHKEGTPGCSCKPSKNHCIIQGLSILTVEETFGSPMFWLHLVYATKSLSNWRSTPTLESPSLQHHSPYSTVASLVIMAPWPLSAWIMGLWLTAGGLQRGFPATPHSILQLTEEVTE